MELLCLPISSVQQVLHGPSFAESVSRVVETLFVHSMFCQNVKCLDATPRTPSASLFVICPLLPSNDSDAPDIFCSKSLTNAWYHIAKRLLGAGPQLGAKLPLGH